MSVFFTLLPIYIFGNLHCIGMCGPLVLMLGRHRHRYFYFLGRTLAFAIAGLFAGGMGAVLQAILQRFHISALTSFFFGGGILIAGLFTLLRIRLPSKWGQSPFLKNVSYRLSTLLLKDRPFPVFLFGLLTITLPCGQTVIVYSALALEGDLWVGFFNGLIFSLMTSPSLVFAMHAQNLFKRVKAYHHVVLGTCAVIVGGMALCRGFAEVGFIPHLILNPGSNPKYHIALY